MDEDQELRESLLTEYMWQWAAAALRQCVRALLPDADNATRLFDAFFAAQAIHDMKRAAYALQRYHGDHWFPCQALDAFDSAHGDVKEVRDTIEHFDEYVVGSGRLLPRGGRAFEPFRLNFDPTTGLLRSEIPTGQSFEIDLRRLRDDIATFVIDLQVDMDALDDEPDLFEDTD